MPEAYIEKVSYRINEKNEIIDVFDSWNNAALVGHADELLDMKRIIGMSIFSVLHDDNTRMYYDSVFQKCRLLKKGHMLEYRCDSPTHKRFMKMELVPLANNDIDLFNYLLREEPFSHPLTIHDCTGSQNVSYTKRCSICKSLQFTGKTE